jgi:hypothetical protein
VDKPENGQRDRRHVAAAKRADVLAQVRVLEDQRDAGVVLAFGKVPTVEQWIRLWLDTIAARRIRPSTASGYRSCLTRIVRDLGHHRIDRLQPEHLEAFYLKIGAERAVPRNCPAAPPGHLTGSQSRHAARPDRSQRRHARRRADRHARRDPAAHGDRGAAATGRCP